MITVPQVSEAEIAAMKQRHRGAELLRLNTAAATERDKEIFERIRAAAKDGPADYDQALADPVVKLLFARGILFFSVKA